MGLRTPPLLYEAVADDISGMIDSGTLAAGKRIPSVRQLSRQRRLSVSTVVQAYRLLEDRGLIEARPQSGYYVRNSRLAVEEPPITQPPKTPRSVHVHALVNKVIADRPLAKRLQLGAAVPIPSALPLQRLQRILSSHARRHPEWAASYSFPPGYDTLRCQISLYLRDWGVAVEPDDIIITNGCMEALNLCLRAVARPGDVIALESPTYFGLLQIIESLGMKALEVPSHPQEGISLQALEAAIERASVKACVLMPTVSNPLGGTVPEAAKMRLVQLLARQKVPLIEDATFSALHFGSVQPYAVKAYDKDSNVMLCSSFSKTFAPGFRIGWAVPGEHYERVFSLKFTNSVGVPDLLQATIAEFLASGAHHRLLRKLRRLYANQLQQFTETITRSFPESTKVSRPTGGYVLWIVMPENVDSTELYQAALEYGIGICPGAMFSATGRYSNCMRINCGMAWTRGVELALQRLGELATKLSDRPANPKQPKETFSLQ